MAKIAAITYTVGQQHTVIELGEYGWSSSKNLIVVSDGVTWKATLGSVPPRPPASSGAVEKHFSRPGMRSMPAEYRLPLLWARKALAGKSEGATAQTDAAETDATQVFPFGAPADCRVTFIGYARRKMAHAVSDLARVFADAAELCNQRWGWYPSNPEVEVHTTSRAMGLAFEPGRKRHRISLHLRLLTDYDLPSIRRVILHELCHHYRNERFPLTLNPHDAVFCAELQKVDATLAEDAAKANQSVAQLCTMFYDQRDEEVVKVSEQKKGRRNVVEPVWSPEAGTVVLSRLKSGQLRLRWVPNPGFTWTVKAEPLNDVNFVRLVKRFAPTQLDRIAVRSERMQPFANLLGLAEWLVRGYARLMVQTILYFNDTIAVQTKAPA